ncbi:MAG: hypothetical protein IKO52_11105 [Clostridia bacterium]|nr:hypothetical protein [Clostridia bacterium]
MREKVLHVGSKVYEGRRSELTAALRLQDIASGHEKKFPKKCAKKRFMSEVISMEGEKMASRYNITLPNGVKFTLYYSQEQDKAELISK